jgi:hypothetical protein
MAIAGAEPISPILWVLFAAVSAGPQVVPNRYAWRAATYQRLTPIPAEMAKDIPI